MCVVRIVAHVASILGRLEFTWQLNCNGVRKSPVGRPHKNKLPPPDYFKTNILVDCVGFNPIGLRPRRLDGRIVRYRMSDVVRIEQEGCGD